jgi:MerR family mercuric resistance operon transcriptional regulator
MRKPMTIGGFAEAAGVSVETVRYYQRRGLLATPARSAGQSRVYTEALLKRIAFIRRAQSFGFTLDEIERALALSEKDCASGRELGERKLKELDQKIAELNRVRRKLRSAVDLCADRKPGAPCPFLAVLSGSGSAAP